MHPPFHALLVEYAMDFGWILYMQYMNFVYELCIFFVLCGIYDFKRGLFCELTLTYYNGDDKHYSSCHFRYPWLNYKNEPAINIPEYYMLAVYLTNLKYSYRNGIL